MTYHLFLITVRGLGRLAAGRLGVVVTVTVDARVLVTVVTVTLTLAPVETIPKFTVKHSTSDSK